MNQLGLHPKPEYFPLKGDFNTQTTYSFSDITDSRGQEAGLVRLPSPRWLRKERPRIYWGALSTRTILRTLPGGQQAPQGMHANPLGQPATPRAKWVCFQGWWKEVAGTGARPGASSMMLSGPSPHYPEWDPLSLSCPFLIPAPAKT